MDIKRVLTTIVGLPAVILVILLGNNYVIDIGLCIVALICMHEYFGAITKLANPIKWVGYLACIGVAVVSLLNVSQVMQTVVFAIPVILLILFLHVIITEMKISFKDIAYTFFGIFYIVLSIMFLALIIGLENGKILLGYAIITAWGTDIFAYLIGKKWGKTKFNKVSPKKSVEGCLGGTIGSIICGIIYIYVSSKFINIEISYLLLAISSGILSIISQIGDFAASTIKRFTDIKDFGNLLPGHGGMLDRIDSVIFLAPYAFMIFSLVV